VHFLGLLPPTNQRLIKSAPSPKVLFFPKKTRLKSCLEKHEISSPALQGAVFRTRKVDFSRKVHFLGPQNHLQIDPFRSPKKCTFSTFRPNLEIWGKVAAEADLEPLPGAAWRGLARVPGELGEVLARSGGGSGGVWRGPDGPELDQRSGISPGRRGARPDRKSLRQPAENLRNLREISARWRCVDRPPEIVAGTFRRITQWHRQGFLRGCHVSISTHQLIVRRSSMERAGSDPRDMLGLTIQQRDLAPGD
jgi:hypothetical protein